MAPKTIGRFEVIAELGQSPLGTFYKATDPKRGTVGLLAIESANLTPEAREKVQQLFNRARTATLLNSPNIASIFGGGETAGYVFLSMEFVDGVTLRTAMARDGRMSTNDLIDIARQLCTALDHAQSKGVVHQNLHPGNVKVEWDGAVKLMDYGLDLPGKRSSNDAAAQYAERYASPEHVRGEALTSRSNLYTLGAMLYELATGTKAVKAEDGAAVRDEVLEGLVEPASKVCASVPEAISKAIAKAMSKSPAERYESASALIRELEGYRNSLNKPAPPVIAAAPSSPGGATKPKAKSAYGGPNTSAIFRAMEENFRGGGGRTAVADAPEQTATGPRGLAAPARPTIDMQKAPASSAAEPQNATPPMISASAPVEKPSTAGLPKPAVEVQAPQSEKRDQVSSTPKQVAMRSASKLPAKPVSKKPGFFAGLKLPETKKIIPVAAGMLLAVGLLWGVSRIHTSNSQAAPQKPQQTTESSPAQAAEPVSEEALPESTQASADQPRRRARKTTEVAVAEPAPILMGELVVTSVPEGAQIQVDGRTDPQWVTPAEIGGLSVGDHTITLSKPGYTSVIKSVEVIANQKPMIAVTMQQIAAILSVVSEPAGAAIVVDGKDTGKFTPAQLSVGPGNHQVSLRKDGFFEYSVLASAQSGQTAGVNAAMIKAGRTDQIHTVGKFGKLFGSGNQEMGKLRIKTRPKGAYILVNGKPAPEASPSEFLLNPGSYEVTLQLTGYRDVKRMVNIKKSKRIELDEVFVRR